MRGEGERRWEGEGTLERSPGREGEVEDGRVGRVGSGGEVYLAAYHLHLVK